MKLVISWWNLRDLTSQLCTSCAHFNHTTTNQEPIKQMILVVIRGGGRGGQDKATLTINPDSTKLASAHQRAARQGRNSLQCKGHNDQRTIKQSQETVCEAERDTNWKMHQNRNFCCVITTHFIVFWVFNFTLFSGSAWGREATGTGHTQQ